MTYPTISPELTLDFAKSEQLDPRIIFTRASTGTYLGSDGLIKTAPSGVARFEYDSSGKALGLLIEESRTNGCKYSEDITPRIFAWAVNEATVTTNSTTAPDGTTTADALYETTASGDHRLEYYIQLITNISTSVFVKPNGRNYVSARILSSGNQWSTVVFELTGNGAITKIEDGSTNIVTHVDSSIQAVANGWYKISITTNRTSSTFQYPILLGTCTTSNPTLDATLGAEIFAGDSTKGIYVWGAQFEYEKNFSTSYIPTSGSTVTRAADVASISGTNFSSWFNQSEGSFFLHENQSYTGQNGLANRFELNQNSSPNSNAIAFTVNYGNGTRINSRDLGAAGSINTVLFNVWTQGGSHKYAYGLKQDNFSAVSGVNVGTDTSGTFPPNLDSLSFGANARAVSLANNSGRVLITRLSYYSERVSDTSLQELTA